MSRLTIRKNDIALIEEIEYEPCGEVCDRTSCFDCPVGKVTEKLAHYEDLEEQGRLIIAKYGKGQTVYEVDDETDEICEYEVASNEVWHDVTSDNYDPWNAMTCFREDSPLVFATKEEAEAKLKELQGNDGI